MKNKKDVIIVSIIVLIIAIVLFSAPRPQLSPPCGECTPWVNGSCGATGCEPLELKQGRTCTGELPIPTEVLHEQEDPPLLSPPINPLCVKRCVPMPELCNTPPEIPINESPQNDSTNISTTPILFWNSTDQDNGTIIYDVYFGNETILEEISADQIENYLPLDDLDSNSLYLWQIVAKDEYNETPSPIWRFITGEFIEEPPENPPGDDDSGDDDDDETCIEEELDCIVNTLMVCENNEWIIREICQNGCQNNQCILVQDDETTLGIVVTSNGDINKEVNFNILLESSKSRVEVLLECSLEDLDNNKINTMQETIIIDLETNIEWKLSIPDVLPSGEYILNCELTYKGQTISSTETIALHRKSNEEPKTLNIIPIIIYFLLFLLLLTIIIIFIKKKRKQKRGGKKLGNRSSKPTKTTRRKHKKSSRRNKNVQR
jgi:hypothetical protein